MQFGFIGSFPPMPLHHNRTLLKALIVSLSAHAFLLVEVFTFLPVRPEASPMTISVSIQPAVGERQLPQSQRSESGVLPATASATKPKRLKASPRVLAVADPSSIGTVPAEVFTPPMSVESSGDFTSDHAGRDHGGGDVPAPRAIVQPSPEDGVSAEAVRQYRTSLAISAKRFKRYPALARERGWEGDVEVVLDFHRVLPGPEVSVASSSGKAVLDEQAAEMIRQAARTTEVPDGLKGRNFRMRMPISFSLSNER